LILTLAWCACRKNVSMLRCQCSCGRHVAILASHSCCYSMFCAHCFPLFKIPSRPVVDITEDETFSTQIAENNDSNIPIILLYGRTDHDVLCNSGVSVLARALSGESCSETTFPKKKNVAPRARTRNHSDSQSAEGGVGLLLLESTCTHILAGTKRSKKEKKKTKREHNRTVSVIQKHCLMQQIRFNSISISCKNA
jgi:hypothetical protein